MVKRNNISGFRIDRCEVASLVLIAERAREGQIFRLGRATMFLGDDVVYLVGGESHGIWNETILTQATARSLTSRLNSAGI